MNPRIAISLTCVVILVLAGVEGLLTWHYLTTLKKAQAEARAAQTLAQLNETQSELKRLIAEREKREKELAAQAQARTQTQDPLPAPLPGMDSFRTPAAAAPIRDSALDVEHLVKVANLLAGDTVATLKRRGNRREITYRAMNLDSDDPFWVLLEALKAAEVVETVGLSKEMRALDGMMDQLEEAGISRKKLVAADALGFEGLVVTLRDP